MSFQLPPPPPSEYAAVPASRTGERPRLGRVALLAVLLSVIAGFAGGVIATQLDQVSSDSGDEAYTQVTAAPVVSDAQDDDASAVARVAQRLANSVVTISSDVQNGLSEGEATGTGVVVTSDGELTWSTVHPR
ncbi:MAG: hypothetical protein RIQ63_363 [Actinomycetota bacterium]